MPISSEQAAALLSLTRKYNQDQQAILDQQDQQDQQDKLISSEAYDQLRNDLEELLYNKLYDKLYYDLYNNVYDQVESEVHNMLCERLDYILDNLEKSEHEELQKLIIDNIKHQVNGHMKEGICFKSIYSDK